MARPLRIEFPGAIYHLTARGNARQRIFRDDQDCELFLQVLGQVCARFRFQPYAYCLMPNHYHLVAQTAQGNLARAMRQLNGVVTQQFNRRHRRVGHLLQGRYKAIFVDRDSYLMALVRYVELNPVRAKLVTEPGQWKWSSYRAMVGRTPAPNWLQCAWVWEQFGGPMRVAQRRYAAFVGEGGDQPLIWTELRQQLYLGDDEFVKRTLRRAGGRGQQCEVPRVQRRSPVPSLSAFARATSDRQRAMAEAYASGAYSMREIGEHFRVHYSTVSRAVRRQEPR